MLQESVEVRNASSSRHDRLMAMNSIDNVLESLCDMRSVEKFHKLFECISVIAELLEVALIKRRTAMRSVYRAAAGGADVSVEDYYRITVYYPTIDNIMKTSNSDLVQFRRKLLHWRA